MNDIVTHNKNSVSVSESERYDYEHFTTVTVHNKYKG